MQDRVSLYPGRVTLTPVPGQENTYDMKRADQPTQEGDPLNKNTLLKDATAALFGLGNSAVPDNVLEILSDAALLKNGALQLPSGSKVSQVKIQTGTYTGTGTAGQSNPNSLSADFNIAFMAVYDANERYFEGNPMVAFSSINNSAWINTGAGEHCVFNWEGKKVSWYDSNGIDSYQLNESGRTYGYILIGSD